MSQLQPECFDYLGVVGGKTFAKRSDDAREYQLTRETGAADHGSPGVQGVCGQAGAGRSLLGRHAMSPRSRSTEDRSPHPSQVR